MKLPEKITPLIDGDWIVYMACSAIEYPLMKEWKEKVAECEEKGIAPPPEPDPSFDSTVDVLEGRLKEIKNVLETEAAPLFFYTGKGNFREGLATTKTYKGNRDKTKPFHYENLKIYIETRYSTYVEDGLEADDLLAMVQTKQMRNKIYGGMHMNTCIVTVDKDLRQVNGWHFSPEGHNFPSFGPRYCDDTNTYIEPKNPDKISKGLVGSGFRFFYSQLITGDTVDNIPGLPKHGPAAALQILGGCDTERKCFEAVREAYRDVCLMADDYLLEQANLLWMVRERDDDGSPVMWKEPIDDDSEVADEDF